MASNQEECMDFQEGPAAPEETPSNHQEELQTSGGGPGSSGRSEGPDKWWTEPGVPLGSQDEVFVFSQARKPGSLVPLTRSTNLLLVVPARVTGILVPKEWTHSMAMRAAGLSAYQAALNQHIRTPEEDLYYEIHQSAMEAAFREPDFNIWDHISTPSGSHPEGPEDTHL